MAKLWGGRFEKETDKAVEAFTASIGVDGRLWAVDIAASQAHARMLGATGILSKADSEKLIQGLEQVKSELASGALAFDANAEDVHSEIERFLSAKVGDVAGKLHTARSRNDQVATDTRLYLREQLDAFQGELAELCKWFVDAAAAQKDVILPGMTHMQHAQPVSLAHHLLAYFWMFDRDRARLSDVRARVNQLPLGSAALAGTSFPIDREMVARELGFEGVCENSLDAVSDRDFIVEFLAAASLVGMHLSRLSEELVLWSSPSFGWVQLDDAVTTGSSIMPQKKNPDVAELIRGRAGRPVGALVAMLTTLKALPLAYNRDLQEDKEQLFTGLDTARSCVRLMKLMLESASFNSEKMRAALAGDFSNATDVADYLVRKGLPFRQAHEVVGRIVRTCLESGKALEAMTAVDFKPFSPLFEADIVSIVTHEAVLAARTSRGGAGPKAVAEQLARARQALSARSRF